MVREDDSRLCAHLAAWTTQGTKNDTTAPQEAFLYERFRADFIDILIFALLIISIRRYNMKCLYRRPLH